MENQKIQEETSFKDIAIAYSKELKIMNKFLPPIFHYGLNTLKSKFQNVNTFSEQSDEE